MKNLKCTDMLGMQAITRKIILEKESKLFIDFPQILLDPKLVASLSLLKKYDEDHEQNLMEYIKEVAEKDKDEKNEKKRIIEGELGLKLECIQSLYIESLRLYSNIKWNHPYYLSKIENIFRKCEKELMDDMVEHQVKLELIRKAKKIEIIDLRDI